MALDTNKAKNSLFGGLAKVEKLPDPGKVFIQPDIQNPGKFLVEPEIQQKPENTAHKTDQNTPKYQTFDKVTALLTTEQKDGLDRIAKKVMKLRSVAKRGVESERITANTILRSLIENFIERETNLDQTVINNEDEAKEWISKLFK